MNVLPLIILEVRLFLAFITFPFPVLGVHTRLVASTYYCVSDALHKVL